MPQMMLLLFQSAEQKIWLCPQSKFFPFQAKWGEKKRYSAILWEKEGQMEKQQNLTNDEGLVCPRPDPVAGSDYFNIFIF